MPKVGKQIGHPLDLVQDRRAPDFGQEPPRIFQGMRPYVGRLQRKVGQIRKRQPAECRPAGLARSGGRYDRRTPQAVPDKRHEQAVNHAADALG